ncbi:MAG: M23 family metallopeptidase [Ardenticatenales bacterium]|nr:M23 family metallopeptidase [Ardenticatenales bacterium]
MASNHGSRAPRRRRTIVGLALLLGVPAAVLLLRLAPWVRTSTPQHARVIDWIRRGPDGHDAWRVFGGNRCAGAPMMIPSDGFIGYGWDDAFFPGHHHTGFDIFSPDGQENVTPVFAAFDGLLTREADWRSAVIIRHPAFPPDFAPLDQRPPAGGTIWTYYAHMASADGATSFVAPAFPPGTRDRPVRAGELLGRQGTWSGDPAKPVGLHLHFSIVEGVDAGGGYANETELATTYDPAPFLGVARDGDGVLVCGSWEPDGGAVGDAVRHADSATSTASAPGASAPTAGSKPPP